MKKVEFKVESKQDQRSLERLAGMLNRTTVGTRHAVDCVQWELSLEDGFIRCQFPLGPEAKEKKSYCEKVGRILAEYTLTELEPSLLRTYYEQRCGFKEPVEVDALIAEAVILLDGEPEIGESRLSRGRDRRIRKLASKFSEYLAAHDNLHLDGFLRFRLGDYRAEIFEAAETAVEERLMERQYQEFMRLLQSMVEWQETKTSAVHVMHAGGHAFRLLDEEMRPMDDDVIGSGEAEEEEEESLVVSRLLAASPKHLYIHTPEPDSQVIRTIMGIFGERAAVFSEQPLH